MKLLVMSDSHGNISRMRYAVEREMPDVIIHLGDHISDARELRGMYPEPACYMVKGNCDVNMAGETELFLNLGGVPVFITHGHRYSVKSGLGPLFKRARELQAAIALYGHTHQDMIWQASGLWLMNPGQMLRHDSIVPASYGVIVIEGGAFDCRLEYLPL